MGGGVLLIKSLPLGITANTSSKSPQCNLSNASARTQSVYLVWHHVAICACP